MSSVRFEIETGSLPWKLQFCGNKNDKFCRLRMESGTVPEKSVFERPKVFIELFLSKTGNWPDKFGLSDRAMLVNLGNWSIFFGNSPIKPDLFNKYVDKDENLAKDSGIGCWVSRSHSSLSYL
jgi:hypothetical protein